MGAPAQDSDPKRRGGSHIPRKTLDTWLQVAGFVLKNVIPRVQKTLWPEEALPGSASRGPESHGRRCVCWRLGSFTSPLTRATRRLAGSGKKEMGSPGSQWSDLPPATVLVSQRLKELIEKKAKTFQA